MNPELSNGPENEASVFTRRLFGLLALAAAATASLDKIEAEIAKHEQQIKDTGVDIEDSLVLVSDHLEEFANLGISGYAIDEARWSPDNVT